MVSQGRKNFFLEVLSKVLVVRMKKYDFQSNLKKGIAPTKESKWNLQKQMNFEKAGETVFVNPEKSIKSRSVSAQKVW